MREQKPSARILIADDHQLLADACKSLLEPSFGGGIVTDGRRLIAAAAELKPDIIILDIYMPHLNGLDAGAQVKQKLSGVKLVFRTMTMDADVAAEAFRCGASAYVLKQSAGDELLLAIRKVNQGASYLSPLIARETVTYLVNQGENFSQGNHTKEKAKSPCGFAERNGDQRSGGCYRHKAWYSGIHKYRMMETLNVKTNAELLQYAIKRHMTPASNHIYNINHIDAVKDFKKSTLARYSVFRATRSISQASILAGLPSAALVDSGCDHKWVTFGSIENH